MIGLIARRKQGNGLKKRSERERRCNDPYLIEEEKNGYAVKYGDMEFHVSTCEQAMDLEVKLGQMLGKIGF